MTRWFSPRGLRRGLWPAIAALAMWSGWAFHQMNPAGPSITIEVHGDAPDDAPPGIDPPQRCSCGGLSA